ncbi:hypothetical protein B0J12DRAFT_274172 [Macrophomina phaseolina]|uniref:Uncharacterized protein n=1 Tax=Macrophomina phaseolina TaxID=35725 RepID=A0ABQ8FYA6_9PEZI|nr:hypothetical protein B0J12DRAFT_274172 [Macrophomina phaseolina]
MFPPLETFISTLSFKEPAITTPVDSTLSYEEASAAPSFVSEKGLACECEPVFCVQSWPDGCHCQNRARLDCYDTCGGPYPELQDCGSGADSTSTSNLEDFPQSTDAPEEPSSDPKGNPSPECRCEPVFCAQSWPLSCQCSNQAASDCAHVCGWPAPQFLVGLHVQSAGHAVVVIFYTDTHKGLRGPRSIGYPNRTSGSV